MNIGGVIKNLRKEQGITQEELATVLNISPQSVSKWENGAANPDIEYITLIAKFFKVSIETLFMWESTDIATEYVDKINAQKRLLVEDNIDSIIELWEDMHFKYPNDYRILKQLIVAMCSKNDKALFDKIFRYAITALKNNCNSTIENEILDSLKKFMLHDAANDKEEAAAAQALADVHSKLPLNQHEINTLFGSEKPKKANGKRVMIVDDAPFMRSVLKDVLREDGYEVIAEAVNGVEAVEAYKEHKSDVVLMDIIMPEMDGAAASRQILSFDPNACIVMCSALSQHDIVLDAIHLGARAFVAKPFKKETLLDTLNSLV